VQIEELSLHPSSSLVGQTIVEARLRERFGILLVALRRTGGGVIFDPPETSRVAAEDTLVVMGRRPDLDRFERVTAGTEPA
jgi:voltage-gated potassium channel